jgi:DNA-binding PadR family transcriptional regulator
MYLMSKLTDTTRFRSMEFFLLALVGKCGLTSLYSLRERAGLQPGAIAPAIRELENLDFITRTEPGARMRREIRLSEAGSAFLEASWIQSQRDYPEMESVLRGTMIALLMADSSAATKYLQDAIETRERQADEARSRAQYLDPLPPEILDDFAWMRSVTEMGRRKSEAQTLSRIRIRILARSEDVIGSRAKKGKQPKRGKLHEK